MPTPRRSALPFGGLHALKRAAERYGVYITPRQFYAIRDRLRSRAAGRGEAEGCLRLVRYADDVERWWVDPVAFGVAGAGPSGMIALFDRRSGHVLTFLPKGAD